jgi:hypothetical protein
VVLSECYSNDSLDPTTLPPLRLYIVCDGILPGGHRHGAAYDCVDSVIATEVYVREGKSALRS